MSTKISAQWLSIYEDLKNKLDLDSPIICCYDFDLNPIGAEIFLKTAEKLPNYQFLILQGDEEKSILSQSLVEKLDNLFLIRKSLNFYQLIKTINLLVFFSDITLQKQDIIEATKASLPLLCFSKHINDYKLLECNNCYVLYGRGKVNLFLLFIRHFFERNNYIVLSKEKISFTKLDNKDSHFTMENSEVIMIEESKKLDYASQGAKLQEEGDLERAISSYKKALLTEQNHKAWVYCNLLNCLNSLDKFQEAIEFGLRGIEVCSELGDLYRLLGLAYHKNGNTKEITSIYIKAIEYKPEQPFWVYCALVEILTKDDSYVKANEISRKGLEIFPSNADLHYQVAILHNRQNKTLTALTHLKTCVELDPNHYNACELLGEILLEREEYQESASFLRRAIKIRSDYVWSHYNLGEALFQQKKWDEAEISYRNAFKLNPNLTKVTGRLEYISSLKDEAYYISEYKKQPNNPDLCFELAQIFARQSRLNLSIQFYHLTLKLYANYQEAEIKLKEVLERQKRLHEFYNFDSEESAYGIWLKSNTPKTSDLEWMPEIVANLGYKPKISIIVPTYNTPEEFLHEMILSVIDQTYAYWELCIADDASSQPHVKKVLQEYANIDHRIKITFRKENGHISAASNSALELATGEYIALLDHDDLLTPDALYEVVLLLNQHPEADMVYSDEDKINEESKLLNPFFKPDWCPDSFLSRMYTCHFGVYRHDIIRKINGFRLGYEGSQDYDLVLRFTEKTEPTLIFHIPKILYHWRIHSASAASGTSAKPYAYEAGARALQDALYRRGEPGKVISRKEYPGVYLVRYDITDYKLVSIIIPTRNLGDMLNRCLESIFYKSTYPNYEVIVIDNGSDEPQTLKILEQWQQQEPERFKCYKLDIPFNYSKINNYATRQAQGDYLLFLNNDTEVISSDWIEGMVEQAQRKSIGAVGALLMYPDNTIQHAGVLLGVGGIANHGHRNFKLGVPGYFSHLISINNYSAVTAACLMCSRENFERVNGFNEKLQVAFNDIDLCLKFKEEGLQNVYLPHVTLYHHESKSRGLEDTASKKSRLQEESSYMQMRWNKYIANDPCYSPNLTCKKENYTVKADISIKINEIQRIEVDNSLILGCCLDEPVSGEIITDDFKIKGWVLGNETRVAQIKVICNEKVIKNLPLNMVRIDVCQLYKRKESEFCGFQFPINIINLPQEATLKVYAVLDDNKDILLSILTIYWE